jgi:hypothetical protein
MPFETRMSEYNSRIHTSGDTLANMDSTGAKALKFSQMALAYIVEMAADTSTPPPVVGLPVINEIRSNLSVAKRPCRVCKNTKSIEAGNLFEVLNLN